MIAYKLVLLPTLQEQRQDRKPIWHSGQSVELQLPGLSRDASDPKKRPFPIDLHFF